MWVDASLFWTQMIVVFTMPIKELSLQFHTFTRAIFLGQLGYSCFEYIGVLVSMGVSRYVSE